MRKLYYALFFLGLLGIPALVLSKFVHLNIRALLLTVIVSLIIGQIVEVWAVRHGKKDKSFVFEYSSKFILGPKIFDIPIEDFIIFLILTPVFLIYFYEFMKQIV
jgi:lycopene cyclase domain-containing protein